MALRYTFRVIEDDLGQRTSATKLGVHPIEGLTAFTALQDIVEDAAFYDPYLEPPIDLFP